MSNQVFDEEREIAEALDCLRATYSKSDYEPDSPNDADELTDEAFTTAADALIKPFAAAYRKAFANG
jgi:hypothetical protein